MKKTLGLYLHIPFCKSKCLYCDFYSKVLGQAEKGKYISALLNQMRFWAEKVKDRTVDSVYIGGGTPTVLGKELLCKLIEEVYSVFNIAKDVEFTIEANPESATIDTLKSAFLSGANRISIGAQSFCDSELLALGRAHNSNDITNAVNNARSAGFSNISLDLMFGIPGQTIDTLKYSLTEILNLNPRHISAYALKIEKGTPYYVNQSLNLPDEEEEFKMYRLICDTLKENQYIHYEISNFAKEGYYSRHNLRYWHGGEYLGLGAASHSYINGGRFFNCKDIDLYIKECEKGEVKAQDVQKIDEREKAREYIMLGLRLSEGVDFDIIKQLFGDEKIPLLEKEVEQLVNLGYCFYTVKGFALTEDGYWVSNTVISQILSIM